MAPSFFPLQGTTAWALLALALAVLGIAYLAQELQKSRRLAASRSRSSVPSSPPPEKRPVKVAEAQNVSYKNVFPPSMRAELVHLGTKFASASEIDLSTLPTSRLLKLEEDPHNAAEGQYVFSGFSVRDLRLLGTFPDYATLSGVPLPSPLLSFNIEKALPRPYRPFRWPYHQTMSLTKLEPDFWIELENTYQQRVAQREQLFAQHGAEVLAALPGSELACRELMEMVLQFLCARYPKQFRLEGTVLVNEIRGTRTDLATMPPLEVLLHNVPEDFGIMLRDPSTGRYVLRAGMVCSSVGWKLSEKVGLGLPGIHKVVPDYKEKMEFSMDRFFTKMPVNKPIQRGSWGLEIGQPLFLPSEHPDFAHREKQSSSLTADDVYLRVDWQTLRRLPLSGAVVFNFKALFTPLTAFRDEPYIPSLLLKVLREGKDNLMKYKGTWHVEHVAKPTLEEYERFQLTTGLMEKGWEPQTLAEAPFFRGWERKWEQ